MELRICDNKEEWDNLLKQQGQNLRQSSDQAEFLQSWNWGEFQASTGKPAIRLQAVENGEVKWQGQCLEHKLGLGLKYTYLPRVMEHGTWNMEQLLLWLKEHNFSFLRIEPSKDINLSIFQSFNLSLTNNRQPRTTLILDLTQSEETLLADMHSKTRYNISLAERKGVQVKDEKNSDVFWALNQTTTERDKFKSHGKEYYAKMLQYDFTHQLIAYYNDIPIATILLIVFGDKCVYLHGASSNEERNLMAPYLLQWRGIQLAKKLGCKYYDFWGVAPAPKVGEPSSCFHNLCWEVGHKWTGVTRFKVGFGGTVRSYPGAFDIILSRWKYGLYQLIRKAMSFRP